MTRPPENDLDAVRDWLRTLAARDFYGVVSIHMRSGAVTHLALRQTLKLDSLPSPAPSPEENP